MFRLTSNDIRREWTIGAVAVLFLALLAACGNGGSSDAGSTEQETSGAKSEGAAAFPRTIKHAKGEAVLESRPKKVAITFFPYADHLFAIGAQDVVAGVVGYKSLQNFRVYEPFLKDGSIVDLGDAANLETIMALDPDVIIAWEDDEKIYDQLSRIATTIMLPQSENWQDTIGKVAEVIGEEAKAERYIADYNDKLQKLADKMNETGMKGKTAIFMMTWGKGFNYYGGLRMIPYYDKLGFSKFKDMQDWGEISLEGVAAVNPDYIFLGEDFTGTAELTLKELKSNSVWNNLNAVKNNHLYVVDTEIVGPLAMGQSKGLDVIEGLIK